MMYGKSVAQPRLTAWYADENCEYTYTGLRLKPLTWTSTLLAIKSKLETETEHKFNSVLCNLYRSGKDYISFHADNEKELGREPFIASLSLGGNNF